MQYLPAINLRWPFALLPVFCGLLTAQSQPLTLGTLLNRPMDFDGKHVTVRATYRYGFEWQELYCVPNQPSARVWLEIPPDVAKAAVRTLKRFPKQAGTINATFTGQFFGQRSTYGDGGYQYQLLLEKIEHAEVISRSSPVPNALPPRELSRVCRCDPNP
jgi:hypothetical protein